MHLPLSRSAVILVCLGVLLAPRVALAQAKPQEISFETADKVELKGTFFAGGGKNASAVILLHELGGDRSKGGWEALGKKLSADGFSVLAFDFRAHGESTTVDPKYFWNYPTNARTFRPNKTRDKISLADLLKNQKFYLPMLVNDIIAAKKYMDQRNDAADCNTSNTIVVGAKEGAALGAIWMRGEMGRRRMIPNAFNPMFPPQPDPKGRMEGEDIRSAIWLSIPEKLGADSMATILKFPVIRDKVPMAFFYGEKDDVHAKAAQNIYNAMGGKSLDATKLRVKEKTASAGGELLGKEGLGTEDDISAYIKTVMDRKAEKPWAQRDAEKLPLPPIK